MLMFMEGEQAQRQSLGIFMIMCQVTTPNNISRTALESGRYDMLLRLCRSGKYYFYTKACKCSKVVPHCPQKGSLMWNRRAGLC